MKPILFTIGPITIGSFGVVHVVALLLSLFVMWRLYKRNLAFLRFRVTLDDFFDSVIIVLVSFGIGARLLHIAEHFPSFGFDIFRWLLFLHFPGFSFLGGVLGAAFGLWLFCRSQKKPFLLLADLMCIGFSLTLSLSRIGSLLNGDAFGKETSFFVHVSLVNISGMRHATQLYEAILAFAIFALLYYLYSKGRLRDGECSLYFLLLIGIVRFLVEFLRGDSVYFYGIAVAQIIAALFVAISITILALQKRQLIVQTVEGVLQKVKHG